MHEALKNPVAIGTACSILTDIQSSKIDQHMVINAYNHFDALTERSYDFNCIECGFHPPILIADANSKIAFKCKDTQDELSRDTSPEIDLVDSHIFWGIVKRAVIAKGFRRRALPGWHIKPSMTFWAPFIGEKSRMERPL